MRKIIPEEGPPSKVTCGEGRQVTKGVGTKRRLVQGKKKSSQT
jgi:hypothetical protein